jgi:hypothetical protein
LSDEEYATYEAGIVSANKALAQGSAIANKVIAANLEMSVGLNQLAEDWDDNYASLLTAKKGSIEYAKALNAIKDSMKTAFGVEVSDEFLLNGENSLLLNQVLNGDTNKLVEL